MIVDVHAHGLSEDFLIAEANDPRGWCVEIAVPRRYIATSYGPLDLLLYDIEGRLAHLRARDVAPAIDLATTAFGRRARPYRRCDARTGA